MKMFRLVSVLVALAVALAVIPAALAQDTLGLSDSDFALWSGANATSSAQSSFNYAFTTSLSVAGIPDADSVSLNINGSGGITADSFSMLIDGMIMAGRDSLPAALEVRVLGNNLYINLGGTWYGGDPNALMDVAGGALPVDPADLASGDLGGLVGDDQMMSLLSGLSELQPSDFLSAQRLPDTAEGFAVIQLSIGIADLLTSDAFAPVFGGLVMGSMGGSMSGMAAPTVDPAQAMMAAQMFGSLFENAQFTLTQTIDPATSLVQRTVINLNLPLGQLMAMSGQSSAADGAISLVFDIALSDYGAGAGTEAPASFEPLENLFQSLNMLAGSM
ncbi:MAG: hypothetical protein ACUVS2_03880 [Candidatus Flexifilum sp.]